MINRFAASDLPSALTTRVFPAGKLTARAMQLAANDNRSAIDMHLQDQLLRAALLQFAEHGMGAARHARGKAERAFFAGDRRAYRHWLGITRQLDSRLAQEAERMAEHLSQLMAEQAGEPQQESETRS